MFVDVGDAYLRADQIVRVAKLRHGGCIIEILGGKTVTCALEASVVVERIEAALAGGRGGK